jgi:hypothetical protein
MVEFNFLTIIVSLAVCSLLVYAVFQYTKVRLSVLEQSHKEQAMILQQYIEESSTDIHRLYQMTTSGRSDSIPNNGGGSIILEYANDCEKHVTATAAYNEPHTIHLDTAFFQNKRNSNLIEISSDSEDTSDSESEATSESESDATDQSDDEIDESDDDGDNEQHVQVEEHVIDPENVEHNETANHSPSTETKLVTVDLGTIQELDIKSSTEPPFDVLSMLYKKAQQTPLPEDSIDDIETPHLSVVATQEQNVPAVVTLTGMSVTELKSLLKEKYKNHPEKHAEIQKLKKAELINALQQTL